MFLSKPTLQLSAFKGRSCSGHGAEGRPVPALRHHLAARGNNALGITHPRRLPQSSETTQNKGTSTQIESKQDNSWQSLCTCWGPLVSLQGFCGAVQSGRTYLQHVRNNSYYTGRPFSTRFFNLQMFQQFSV